MILNGSVTESLLNDLSSKYPGLCYEVNLDSDDVVIFYDNHFSGRVSFLQPVQEFINWVLYYYDMGRQLQFSGC